MGWVERESTSEEESKARLESREAGIRKNEWANLKKKKNIQGTAKRAMMRVELVIP